MFFSDSRPDRKKRAEKLTGPRLQLANSPIPEPKRYELLTTDELFSGHNRTFFFDTECYKNYWCICFKCEETGKIVYFENSPETQINYQLLSYILHRFLCVGFNSEHYDKVMIALALMGLPTYKLKFISDEIIKGGKRTFEICQEYGCKVPKINHIDLINVAPIEASLKIYAGRLHCERMQDLPFPEDRELSKSEALIVRDYCINDLDNTQLLYNHVLPHIKMRETIGAEYEMDLRSKSDAQVAEAVIGAELEALGVSGSKPIVNPGDQFYYQVPEFIRFKTPQFQKALAVVRETPFIVGAGGSAECPEVIDRLNPRLGTCVYKLGVGGLHSSEKSVCYVADENTYIIDRDVASYYPRIILNNKLFPKHLGEAFLTAYDGIVTRRLKLKKMKDPLEAGLKIAINGTFGKLGNKYSKMYSPDLLLQVCMTGQLSLLMLIESIELAGIPVISANTDGVVIKCPKHRYKELETIVMIWENATGFDTEETRYKGIYSRDVNNYYAVKYKEGRAPDGAQIWLDEIDGVKKKGTFSEKGSAQNSVLSKNPEGYISSYAVQQFLAYGIPISETVTNCRDIGKFVSVRTVKGGAHKDGVFLGKAIRWYYAMGETGTINYVISGNNVPKSEGAKPLMTLPVDFPNDIDFDHYINVANEILFDIGYYQRKQNPSLFGG